MSQNKPPLLDSYRVLDLADEKGALCGKFLACLGADVVKVERPNGDPSRNIGPFYRDIPHPEKSLHWFAYNTGKRGITLNIETASGQEIFKKLTKSAHFIIESFLPGYLDSLGLGYQALSEINPRIIVTSITPFGQTGPYSNYKSSDLIITSMGGLDFMFGNEDRPPVRISHDQSYPQASAQAVVGTLMAHYYREFSGEGQHVDVSMQESVMWTVNLAHLYWHELKYIFKRSGGVQKQWGAAYTLIFACKDGYVSYRVGLGGVGAITEGQARLVEAMNAEGLGLDMKDIDWKSLSINKVPQEDVTRWESAMAQYFARRTKQELYDDALRLGYMLVPVNNIKDIVGMDQLSARDFWLPLEHDDLGTTITYPGSFFKSAETQWQMSRRAPLIGEHNEDIYERELGLGREELIKLKEGNII